jgi:hypothetical protein
VNPADDLPQRLKAEARRARRKRRLGSERQCSRCPEADPGCLAPVVTTEGMREVLCRRCRAESIAPQPAEYQGPRRRRNDETCQLCLYDSRLARVGVKVIEWHHLLGRAHHPHLTVAVCVNCHAKLTEHQRDIGANLRSQPDLLARLTQAIPNALAYVIGVYACTRDHHPILRTNQVLLASITAIAGLYEVATNAN